MQNTYQCINDAGLQLIKEFEGCRLHPYPDSVGVWTIGYGHTEGVSPLDLITQEQADEFLRKDLADSEKAVNENVNEYLTPNQFSALVSFVFNVGATAFKKSTLLLELNKGFPEEAADQLLRWDKAGGVALAGLTRRRIAERTLFLKD